jgi:hypothetical protein
VQAALGAGRYVSRVNGNDVYFEPGAYDRLAANATAMTAVLGALKTTDGIADVFPADLVRSGATAKDPLLRGRACYFPPQRRPRPRAQARVMSSSAPRTDRQPRRPGYRWSSSPGVKPGVYEEQVTPADIAPTLAALCGFTLQNVDGQILTTAPRPATFVSAGTHLPSRNGCSQALGGNALVANRPVVLLSLLRPPARHRVVFNPD